MHTRQGEVANAQNHINLLWHCANMPKPKAGTHGFRSLRRSSKTTLVKFWKDYGWLPDGFRGDRRDSLCNLGNRLRILVGRSRVLRLPA